jgi:hypothetical protein
MLSTVPAAVVEPKGKSQNPAAKAKRLKGLRTNPDFAEAVSEERAAAKKGHGDYMTLHDELIALQHTSSLRVRSKQMIAWCCN